APKRGPDAPDATCRCSGSRTVGRQPDSSRAQTRDFASTASGMPAALAGFQIGHEFEAERALVVGFTLNGVPQVGVDGGEVRVAVEALFDMGNTKSIGERHRLRIDLATAGDEDFAVRA